jgi:hypothetical protein
MTQQDAIPSRHRANMFDIPVKGDGSTHGVDASSEAIGGYYSMGWYKHFKDAETGEVYRVHCSDGVYGGNGSYTNEDERWRQVIYYALVARCHELAKSGVSEIRISRNERVCMQGFTHVVWLESEDGLCDGKQSQDGLEGGFVGHCLGIPIICDLDQEDDYPPCPPKPEVTELEIA